MALTDRHREAEAAFREMVRDAELPEPDAVDYETDCIVFFWTGPKVAVIVDFDGEVRG